MAPSLRLRRINSEVWTAGGALAGASGVAQLDAPVSGGVKGAVAGTLAFMIGGEDAALELARPVLEPMAGKIIHCGAAGAGQAAKVCNNMVLAVHQIAIGEAFVLAEKLGLSAQSLFDVITGATGNWVELVSLRVKDLRTVPPSCCRRVMVAPGSRL